MSSLFQLLEENFSLFFALCLAWVLGASLFFAFRRKARGSTHPAIEISKLKFLEKFVSGFSHKSLFTRFGGARNALVVTVSNDAVLIEPVALLKWIMPMGFNDLEHYIPKANIVNVRTASSFGRGSIQIEFRSNDGTKKTVELILRKPQEFLAALTA